MIDSIKGGLDSSFPKGQFKIPGYKQPYRFDMSSILGGLSILVNDQLSSKLLGEMEIALDIQILPIKLTLNSKKWLLLPIYKPPKQQDTYFREHLSGVADFYSRTYDSTLVIGDFNLEVNSPTMRTMMNDHNFSCLIQTPMCFKSKDGRCIDLILTYRKSDCFTTETFETGFSDFHYMCIQTLEQPTQGYLQGLPNLEVTESSQMKNLEQNLLRNSLDVKLTQLRTQRIYLDTLNQLAPLKKSPFVEIINPICLRSYGKP